MRIDSKPEKYLLLPKNAVSFKIVTVSRKFYLAANTRGEFEEWFAILGQLGHSVEGHNVHDEISRSFTQLMRPKSRIDDSDARSVYSAASREDEDDTFSIVSGTSKDTSLTDRESLISNTTSNFDTLVFIFNIVLLLRACTNTM